MGLMQQTQIMERFPLPVWEWSRQMQDIYHNHPHRIEDFAKSYSRNQFISKTWMIEVLKVYADIDSKTSWWLMGSWYGSLTVPLINSQFHPSKRIHLVDFDKEALQIAEKLHGSHNIVTHNIDVNWEMKRLSKVKADIWINTSCEHMYPLTDEFTPEGLCVFQSTNYTKDPSHINCSDTLDDFIEQCNFKELIYSGEKPFHDYDNYHKRFMVLGYK